MQRAPSIADVAANVLDGLLVDQVANDLRRLAAINSFFVEAPSTGPLASARAYRMVRGHQPYRLISYALVAPKRRGEIAALAEATFARRYGGVRALRDIDFAFMARALGRATRSRGEFLSFLLFDQDFTGALMDLGRRDAKRWLARHPHFWCRDATHDLSLRPADRSRVIEAGTIDEFRARRRL
jgi:NTE family protein